ncbi:MAG: hypothetical protein B6D41_08725 [Chloroflexi bacterium UTCFX4]|jgi:hypothetical protein|nr:MAG: hypothetical protein B6D41_08725 [Chloroflexi bacterium UTCFX4]
MKRIIARVQRQEYGSPLVTDAELFELPGEQPAGVVVSNLVRALKLPSQIPTQSGNLQYWLAMGNGDVIADAQTLTDAGVHNNTLLTLQCGPNKRAPNPARTGVYATLRTPSGEVFDLNPHSLVGRADATSTPEVDLANQPDSLTVSRQHAYIERVGVTWSLTALQTKNQTRLKGQIIPPNSRQPLNDGDEIIFGKVKTIFKLGQS